MRVLVTGTSTFFTPRLIQGFGSHQVRVTAADDHWWSVGKSIPQTRRVRTPSLSHNPAGYLAALIRELKSQPYDLLLPTFEESLLLAEFRDQIEAETQLFLPSFDAMWQVHHKPSLHELCLEHRIPTPPTVTYPVPVDLEEQVRELQFPVVLKLPGGNNCDGMQYCDTLEELVQRFAALYVRETQQLADAPFIQQKISGDAIYTLMLCHEGQKLGEVIYRPLRTFPESGGTSSHRESISHPRIAKLTERLAAATNWSGFLGLDFIVDRVDGTPYLIDANPRANPAVQLGYLAGVDWTRLLINMARGRESEPVTARPGVRCKTPLLDVLWLMDGLRPRQQWMQTLFHRIRQVAKPDWTLDSSHDFQGRSEWLGHLAIGWQGFAAIAKSLLTGGPMCKAFLNGANYNPATVRRLRQSGTPRREVQLEPVYRDTCDETPPAPHFVPRLQPQPVMVEDVNAR